MKQIEILYDYGMIDEKVIETFEKKIQYKLPLEYKKLLVKHNGLTAVQNIFTFINFKNELDESSISFLGFGEWPVLDLMEDYQNFDIYGYDGIVVFGVNGAGDYICFDYRKDSTSLEPEIVFMNHDQYVKDENGEPKMAISKIANSFEEFIDMLHE